MMEGLMAADQYQTLAYVLLGAAMFMALYLAHLP
jgi:hypothetical protein